MASRMPTREASDHRPRSGMMRCPKAKHGKQRRAHDEKRSKKPSASWEAFVGNFTSNEPNLAKRMQAAVNIALVMARNSERATVIC